MSVYDMEFMMRISIFNSTSSTCNTWATTVERDQLCPSQYGESNDWWKSQDWIISDRQSAETQADMHRGRALPTSDRWAKMARLQFLFEFEIYPAALQNELLFWLLIHCQGCKQRTRGGPLATAPLPSWIPEKIMACRSTKTRSE